MTFDAWLKKEHGIDLKTFNLRPVNLQWELIEEYNQTGREIFININT